MTTFQRHGGRATALLIGLTLTLAACSDSPTEPQVTSVQITAPSQEVRVGETLQLTGTAVDAQGNEVSGRTLTWSSSNENRATVSDEGLVTGIAPGQVTISALTGDASGQIVLEVLDPPVASVEVVPGELELRRQQEVQLETILRDADGNQLGDRDVAWSTEDPSVATVSASGMATGQGEGTTRIIAQVDGVEGHAEVTVIVGEIPVIESISPAVLEPGEEFTITGENFSEEEGELQVRVHGVEATILTSSETSITARIPDDLCRPEGPAPVLVFSALEPSDPMDHPYRPTDLLELAAGDYQRITSPNPFCVILGGTDQEAEYIMGVQSTSGTAAARTSVSVEGIPGQPLPVTVAAGSTAAGTSFAEEAARRSQGSGGPSGHDLRWERHRDAKPELRQAEAAAMAGVQRGGGLHAAAAGAARISGDAEAGDTVSVNVPDINANICNDFSTIQAVIRRVGDSSIWLDDVENPAGGLTDGDFQLLADEFDNEIYEEVTSYFGEPTDLDDNDRIVIVNSRKVNEMSANVLGFVVSTDFFPDQCASSNGGEYYYSRVVDPNGNITDPDGESLEYSRSDALSDAPLLLAHEVTHIIQFGRRFQMPEVTGLQAIWLLEGQATLAEEVVGHRYTGNTPGSNLDEFTAFSPAQPTETFWYRNPFVDLSVYYGVSFTNGGTAKVDGAPQECGWLSVQQPAPCISGRIAYGVTWSLLRWISDHFGSEFSDGEREIQRLIVDSRETGFSTFSDVLDRDIFQLMAPWAATLYTDGRVDTGSPLLTFPSWDLRSIESWISEPVRWGPPARLQAKEPPFNSTFQSSFVVAAGSSTYQRLSSDDGHPPFALLAGAGDGGPLPDFMQLWIARIR